MRRLSMVFFAIMLLVAGAAAQDGAVAPLLFPEIAKLGRPEWIQPGMRLTYLATDATVPDNPTGKGSAGMGYVQIDVVAVGPKSVTLNSRTHLLPDGREGTATILMSQAGIGGLPASTADFWVHPDALAAAKLETTKDGDSSTTVARVIHPANGQDYQATCVDWKKGKATISFVWDNLSGVLLFHSSNTPVAGPAKVIVHKSFKGARRLELPWANSPMPSWLRTVKRMEFEGVITTTYPGVPPVKMPNAMRYDFGERGANWTSLKITNVPGSLQDLDAGTPGQPRSEMTVCTGPGMIGGVWIPPVGLATLTTGQVLDKDPLTKVTTTVTHVGPIGERNMVVITEENPIQRIEYHYDARSGGLLRLHATNSRFHTDTLFRLKSTR